MSVTPPPDATQELATLIAGAIAAGAGDRVALLDACQHIIHGGERMKERLGHLVASATISALQSTSRPAADPVAVAQAAFKPREQP